MTEGAEKQPKKTVKIHVRGRLDEEWATWFEGLEIHTTGEDALLLGEVIDQSALYGILARLRDLGLALISVEQVD